MQRSWWADGRHHQTVHYGITSLPPEVASAAQLLALRRGHWTIENRLHYVVDGALGEDASPIRLGAGPSVLALLRAFALNLLRQAGYHAGSARLRHYSRRPMELLPLLGLATPQHV